MAGTELGITITATGAEQARTDLQNLVASLEQTSKATNGIATSTRQAQQALQPFTQANKSEAQSLEQVQRAEQKLTQTSAEYSKQVQELGKNVNALAQQQKSQAQVIEQSSQQGSTAILTQLKAYEQLGAKLSEVNAQVKDFLNSALQYASTIEQVRTQLGVALGDKKLGESTTDFLKKESDAWGIPLKQLGDASQIVANLGQNIEKVIPAIERLAQGTARSFTQTSTVLSQALNGETRAFLTLRKQYGISGKDIKAFGGKVDAKGNAIASPETNRALLDLINTKYSNALQEHGATYMGAMENLENKWNELKAEIGEQIAPDLVTILSFLADVVDWLRSFSPEAKKVGSYVALGVTSLGSIASTVGLIYASLQGITSVVKSISGKITPPTNTETPATEQAKSTQDSARTEATRAQTEGARTEAERVRNEVERARARNSESWIDRFRFGAGENLGKTIDPAKIIDTTPYPNIEGGFKGLTDPQLNEVLKALQESATKPLVINANGEIVAVSEDALRGIEAQAKIDPSYKSPFQPLVKGNGEYVYPVDLQTAREDIYYKNLEGKQPWNREISVENIKASLEPLKSLKGWANLAKGTTIGLAKGVISPGGFGLSSLFNTASALSGGYALSKENEDRRITKDLQTSALQTITSKQVLSGLKQAGYEVKSLGELANKSQDELNEMFLQANLGSDNLLKNLGTLTSATKQYSTTIQKGGFWDTLKSPLGGLDIAKTRTSWVNPLTYLDPANILMGAGVVSGVSKWGKASPYTASTTATDTEASALYRKLYHASANASYGQIPDYFNRGIQPVPESLRVQQEYNWANRFSNPAYLANYEQLIKSVQSYNGARDYDAGILNAFNKADKARFEGFDTKTYEQQLKVIDASGEMWSKALDASQLLLASEKDRELAQERINELVNQRLSIEEKIAELQKSAEQNLLSLQQKQREQKLSDLKAEQAHYQAIGENGKANALNNQIKQVEGQIREGDVKQIKDKYNALRDNANGDTKTISLLDEAQKLEIDQLDYAKHREDIRKSWQAEEQAYKLQAEIAEEQARQNEQAISKDKGVKETKKEKVSSSTSISSETKSETKDTEKKDTKKKSVPTEPVFIDTTGKNQEEIRELYQQAYEANGNRASGIIMGNTEQKKAWEAKRAIGKRPFGSSIEGITTTSNNTDTSTSGSTLYANDKDTSNLANNEQGNQGSTSSIDALNSSALTASQSLSALASSAQTASSALASVQASQSMPGASNVESVSGNSTNITNNNASISLNGVQTAQNTVQSRAIQRESQNAANAYMQRQASSQSPT